MTINAGITLPAATGSETFVSNNWANIIVQVNYPEGQNYTSNPIEVNDYIIDGEGQVWEVIEVTNQASNVFTCTLLYSESIPSNEIIPAMGVTGEGLVITPQPGGLDPYWDASYVSDNVYKKARSFSVKYLESDMITDWMIIDTNIAAKPGKGYLVDCSGGPISITAPSDPMEGNCFAVKDYTGNADTNNITITNTGGDNIIITVPGSNATYIYTGSTYNWTTINSGQSGAAGDTGLNTNFISNIKSINIGESVSFTDTTVSTNEILSWAWEFGDGNTSTEQNPMHTYYDFGTYTVTLTTTTLLGNNVETKNNFISVGSLSAGTIYIGYYNTTNDRVQKLDQDGNTIWTYDGCTDDVNTIAIDYYGYVYTGDKDEFLKKVDKYGNTVWSRDLDRRVNIIYVDENQHIYIAGDHVIFKYDLNGNKIWENNTTFTGDIKCMSYSSNSLYCCDGNGNFAKINNGTGIIIGSVIDVGNTVNDIIHYNINSTMYPVTNIISNTMYVDGNISSSIMVGDIIKLLPSGNNTTVTKVISHFYQTIIYISDTVYYNTTSFQLINYAMIATSSGLFKLNSSGTTQLLYNPSSDVKRLCSDQYGNIYTADEDNNVKKYNSNFELLWTNESNTTSINELTIDQYNNVYTVASSVVRKLDYNGNLIWTKNVSAGNVFCIDVYPGRLETNQWNFADFVVGYNQEQYMTINFQNISIGSKIYRYHWDFGDNQTSTLESPVHTYATPGVYDVTLQLYSQENILLSKTTKNAIPGYDIQPPDSNFSTSATTVGVSQNITFEPINNNGTYNKYYWSFGDGSNSIEMRPLYNYNALGTYSPTLTIENEFGKSTTTRTDLINVTNATVASFTITKPVNSNEVTLIGNTVSGATYSWFSRELITDSWISLGTSSNTLNMAIHSLLEYPSNQTIQFKYMISDSYGSISCYSSLINLVSSYGYEYNAPNYMQYDYAYGPYTF